MVGGDNSPIVKKLSEATKLRREASKKRREEGKGASNDSASLTSPSGAGNTSGSASISFGSPYKMIDPSLIQGLSGDELFAFNACWRISQEQKARQAEGGRYFPAQGEMGAPVFNPSAPSFPVPPQRS